MRTMIFAVLVLLATMTLAVTGLALSDESPVPFEFDGKYALIGCDGRALTGYDYASLYRITPMDDPTESALFTGVRTALLTEGNQTMALINAGGEELFILNDSFFEWDNGRVLFYQDGKCGALGDDFKPLIPAEYTKLAPNREGGFLGVRNEIYDDEPDKLYYIDANGEETYTGIIICDGYLLKFSEKWTLAKGPEGFGFLSAAGEWVIPPQFDYACDFTGDYAIVESEGKTGLIDRCGNYMIAPEYDRLYTLPDESSPIFGLSAASLELLDTKNFEVIARYEGVNLETEPVGGEMFYVKTRGTLTLYNRQGNPVLSIDPEGYVYGSAKMPNRVIVNTFEEGERCYVFDSSGTLLAGPFQLIYILDEARPAVFIEYAYRGGYDEKYNEYFPLSNAVHMRLLDVNARVITPWYDLLYQIGRDRYVFEDGEWRGIIDGAGHVVMSRSRYECLDD